MITLSELLKKHLDCKAWDWERQYPISAVIDMIIEVREDCKPKRYPETVPPPFGDTIIAFEPDGTPHLMQVTETWAHQMFEQGYTDWVEIPGK